MSSINRKNNRISIGGDFDVNSFHYLLSNIHHAIEKAGYQEIQLDFSACTSAFASAMVAICAQVMCNREAGIDISTELPSDAKLKRLFQNTNWAHHLDPRKYDPSTFRGYTQVPLTQYRNPDEQHEAVNRIVNAILGAIPNMERSDFAAFEWAINELTDNVITHAHSSIGGIVQVTTFARKQKTVQFIVGDAGLGIPGTLRETYPELTSDTDALDKAIREGVTRDKSVGQGNGLFGSYQICSHCSGKFQVDSGHGKLKFNEHSGLRISNEKIPYDGTLVLAEINFSKPHLLEEALKFGGEVYTPVDFVETNYEVDDFDRIVFKMKNESGSFGSRPAGTPVRNKLKNLLNE